MARGFDYRLLDFGNGERLEQFSGHIVRRPAPQATQNKLNPKQWGQAQAQCVRDQNKNTWTSTSVFPPHWRIHLGSACLQLRPSSHQIGVFPEQEQNWRWIHQKIQSASRPLRILNLFAYTGMASLVAASAHQSVHVTHVEGAKSTIKWAKENAEISGVSNQIRFICEDVLTFVKKEIRRGKTYDGIVLDPPAFGRGPGGDWKITRDLERLLEMLQKLLSPNAVFVVLSCHQPGWEASDLQRLLQNSFHKKFTDFSGQNLGMHTPAGDFFRLSIGARAEN